MNVDKIIEKCKGNRMKSGMKLQKRCQNAMGLNEFGKRDRMQFLKIVFKIDVRDFLMKNAALRREFGAENEIEIPEPMKEESLSGKFVIRIPKSLHRRLVIEAERESVSLNRYVMYKLAK